MTTDSAPRNLDPSEDPLLDWHSDARVTMDAYANEVAYRQIAGTQVELLRLAAARGTTIAAGEVAMLFDEHRRRCAAEGREDLAFTSESFVGFLTARALLKPLADGYVITSVGRDLIGFIDDRGFPPKAL